MTTPAPDVDPEQVQDFMVRMRGVLNECSLAFLCSIGHQTRLFDTMAEIGPATSEAIADAAGLQERYVREWLGGVTTGRIVDHDPQTATFELPAAHAACLTRAAGPANMGRVIQIAPLLAQVEQPLIAAFRAGGGVPYQAFDRFHALMAESSAARFDALLIDQILPLVNGLPARLESGIDVADIGCGQGHGINLMARTYPNSRFVGFDFSAEAIAAAKQEAQAWGLSNTRFVQADVSALDSSDAFDLMTAFDAIHDQAKPAEVLACIHQMLRSGGTFLMADVNASSHLHENLDHIAAPFLYTVSLMHCMTVSLALDGAGLGTVWGRQKAVEMLGEAGFDVVDIADLDPDPTNSYYLAVKS